MKIWALGLLIFPFMMYLAEGEKKVEKQPEPTKTLAESLSQNSLENILSLQKVDFTKHTSKENREFFQFRLNQHMDLIRLKEQLKPVDYALVQEIIQKDCHQWLDSSHISMQLEMGQLFTGMLEHENGSTYFALDRQGNIYGWSGY
ncbi:hypothetical protein [Persicobacter sp. CCB-QB2]|uniref:hypothetical protein n=1 Tax=Persicobacter sp. CCB-QB2 TaxID=1561025 RepID=UPI0006A9E38C|nr:hypothetical protein [Persicobacter sp. CCB-QB2]